MAQRQSIEDRLNRLKEIRSQSLSPDEVEELRAAIGSANNVVAAAGARAAARCQCGELAPDLVACFERFLERPQKDKGCRAKLEAAKALDDLGHRDADTFLRGSRHVQMEPAYGGPEDTAAELRGVCALALVRIGHPRTLYRLTDLLADPQPGPRQTAARALGFLGGRESELLLRLKALSGDSEPPVSGECFAALMRAAPKGSLDFVARFLEAEDGAVAEQAAVAIGESREQGAFKALRTHRENCTDFELASALLLPIALTRHDEAFEYLLGVVEDGPRVQAVAALDALRLFDDHGERRREVERAVERRDLPALRDAIREWRV